MWIKSLRSSDLNVDKGKDYTLVSVYLGDYDETGVGIDIGVTETGVNVAFGSYSVFGTYVEFVRGSITVGYVVFIEDTDKFVWGVYAVEFI